MAEQEATLMKVGILRDDDETLLRRILPHSGVGGLAKTDVSNVARVRIFLPQRVDETIRKILIK